MTAAAGPDQSFCETATATLAANTPTVGTGTWTLVTGAGTITSVNSANTLVTGLGYGANIFRWTITNGSCASMDDVVITRNTCPSSITLFSSRDSFLRSGADDTNEGANELLRIQNAGDNRGVVGFDLNGISTVGLQSATLVLTIAENSNNWGSNGRLVDAHRLLADWSEGNGRNDIMVGGGSGFRGTGEGATWHCGKDTNIVNQKANCNPLWGGRSYAAATAPAVLHTNGQQRQVPSFASQPAASSLPFYSAHNLPSQPDHTLLRHDESMRSAVLYLCHEPRLLALVLLVHLNADIQQSFVAQLL
jgi:hypothetical protein